jgi:aminocarboxymuconate-semialdehyde decarboxylase
MAVIDVHTHMMDEGWARLLDEHGGDYRIDRVPGGPRGIRARGAPLMTMTPAMFDYRQRIADMDAAGVDLAIVSLTCPNVYWGGREISLRAARIINDSMAAAQRDHPDRIRWLASLPWQYPQDAVAELDRACAAGAVGVMVLANISGLSLSDSSLEPIWTEIDRRALPVLVHPSTPPGVEHLDMTRYYLVATVGFPFDTTLGIARLIFDGFFDRFPNLKLIASHAGGALPYIASRMDHWFGTFSELRVKAEHPPSEYLRHIYFDAVTYEQRALELCVAAAGGDHVLYGSDYPHKVGDMAGCLERVNSLDSRTAQGIRGANAERVFNL